MNEQDPQKYKIKRNWEKKALTDTETDNQQQLSPERKRNKSIKKIQKIEMKNYNNDSSFIGN